ncbi:PREDICTED: uncharacterized protein LOC108556466 [Nicrophorus vespilloides]|uniref:Uncharacterized protein LOC108556466 n=1 Tax=Nicrophorus vespilloides TaxID=110193 RepID=A0ABM1M0I7_NICVS|nr:PREDICTED: uncharacterized protein LOC108556466 [Nicrophorus vespilloides]
MPPKKVNKNTDLFEDSLDENSDEEDVEGRSLRKRFRTPEDIFDFLDDDDKPFIKRLKLAEVFYKKENFDVQNREVVLLTWMCGNEQTDARNLKTCLSWVQSERFKNLDIPPQQSKALLLAILKRVKECEDYESEQLTVSIILHLMNTPLLNKQSSLTYCAFVGELINNIEHDDLLLNLLQSPQLRGNFMRPKFLQNFIECIVIPLSKNGSRYEKNQSVYKEISSFVTWGLFGFKFQYFNEYIKSMFEETSIRNDYSCATILFAHLTNMYSTKNAEIAYKLIFDTFCESSHADSLSKFRFFILLLKHLGFKLKKHFKMVDGVDGITIAKSVCDVHSSMRIASSLFASFAKHEISGYSSINGINLNVFCTEYLKFIVGSFGEADVTLLVQIRSVIKLSPTSIELVAGKLLQFIMRADVVSCGDVYREVLKDIMIVYSKMHRIRQLIDTIITCLKFDGSESIASKYSFCKKLEVTSPRNEVNRIENVLTEDISECFKEGVTKLSYSLAVEVYSIFRKGIKEILENFNDLATDINRVTYVEVLCTLMSDFFKAVSISDRKVPKATQMEFYNYMNDDKSEILGKFGEALLQLKHYQNLISVYLNLCYSWGELYILLNHYSMLEDIKFVPMQSNDNSVFNIVYLHSYLSTAKWNLIYERIENFGSLPCQLIMFKLCIQKLRAMMIFEADGVNEEVETNLMNYLVHMLESNGNFTNILRNFVIGDSLCMLYLLPKMKGKILRRMAGILLWEPCEALKSCESLIEAIYFVCLEEIHKVYGDFSKSAVVQYFGRFKRADFMHNSDKSEVIAEALNSIKVSKKGCSIDVAVLRRVIDVFKFYDVYGLPENALKITVWFMYYLMMDLKIAEVEAEKLPALQSLRSDVEGIFAGLYSSHRIPGNVRNKKLLMNLMSLNIKSTFKYVRQNQDALRDIAEVPLDGNVRVCTSLLSSHLVSDVSENDEIFNEIGEKFINGIDEFCSEDYIEMYCIFYKYYLKDKKKMKIIRRKVDVFRDLVVANKITNMKAVVDILKLFMNHHVEKLDDAFIHELWKKVWNNAELEENVQGYGELLGYLLICVKSDEKFEELLNDVKTVMNKSVASVNGKRFNKLVAILDATMKQNLSNYKLKSLYALIVNLALHLIVEDKSDMLDGMFIPMRRLIAMDEKRHMPTARTMEAICMLVSRKLESTSPHTFNACADLLRTLLLNHKLLCHDRMPSILNQCRALFEELCTMNNQLEKADKQQVEAVLGCAYAFEKLIASIKMSKETVDNNIAVFIIVDILKRYEEVTFNPIVKISVDNCVFHLLTRCDARSKLYLESVLSPASTEIFNDLNTTFRKHYLYMGAS